MTDCRNISRINYSSTSFQGWRLSVSRHSQHLQHYFSDRRYGGEGKSLQAAKNARSRLMKLLRLHADDPQLAFETCRNELNYAGYPQGLRPLKASAEEVQKSRSKGRR